MDEQATADRRFEVALAETGARDPRERYRDLLRQLKERDEDRYREAVARWKADVIVPLAEGQGEPLELWLRFGHLLADLLHPGRTVVVDESGRARPLEPPPSWRDLVLHLPKEARVRAIPIAIPPELSSAQTATLDLLVGGRVKLPDE